MKQPNLVSADRLSRLAVWPVEHCMQADLCCTLSKRVDEKYQDVFFAAIRGYQLYTYLELVARYYGKGVRNLAGAYMLRAFGRLGNARELVEYTLQTIETAMGCGDVSVRVNREQIDVGSEVRVALVLLLSLPESPDYATSELERQERIKTMQPDVEMKLADCLKEGRAEMENIFNNMDRALDFTQFPLAKMR